MIGNLGCQRQKEYILDIIAQIYFTTGAPKNASNKLAKFGDPASCNLCSGCTTFFIYEARLHSNL